MAAQLTKYTAAESARVRRTVAPAWGQMASVDALPKGLDRLLADEDAMVRTSIVDSLALWSKRPSPKLRKAVMPLLIGAMSDDGIHYTHRWALYSRMEELAPANPEIITEMIRIMKKSAKGKTRGNAASSLGDIGRSLPARRKEHARIVAALAEALGNDGDACVTRCAISGLGSMGPSARAALPALRKATDMPDKFLAKQAAGAIAKIGGGS